MPLEITEEIIARQSPKAQAIIRLLLAEIAKLKARIVELESPGKSKTPQNSSLPPSSVHPHAKPPSSKPKSKRKRRGQPGHKKHDPLDSAHIVLRPRGTKQAAIQQPPDLSSPAAAFATWPRGMVFRMAIRWRRRSKYPALSVCRPPISNQVSDTLRVPMENGTRRVPDTVRVGPSRQRHRRLTAARPRAKMNWLAWRSRGANAHRRTLLQSQVPLKDDSMNRIIFPLLTLGLSLAPVLCWAAEPNADQAKAIAEIEKLGGKVFQDEKSPGKPVIYVDLENSKVTDAGLKHLTAFMRLQALILSSNQVTDEGLKHLSGLTKLESLKLGNTRVTDAGLEYLRGMKELQGLDLSYTKVTDAGLEHLKGLSQIQFLDLSATKITSAGIKHLKSLSRLNYLSSSAPTFRISASNLSRG